ncbi:uncharacterized protein BKCO1_5000059 [Diplodia corticola]|uniref:Uncharacterized protein n=1 Tax=Diplodia corticola TaxID=236234 RepID=A0A1J9QTE4_9PEZI|nr:uncharacterized protein BKCO1_5000059 [Diplodia corticola]OJD31258.1 hypothetical protein BKCO1_5000059 [Diplodia corticola]
MTRSHFLTITAHLVLLQSVTLSMSLNASGMSSAADGANALSDTICLNSTLTNVGHLFNRPVHPNFMLEYSNVRAEPFPQPGPVEKVLRQMPNPDCDNQDDMETTMVHMKRAVLSGVQADIAAMAPSAAEQPKRFAEVLYRNVYIDADQNTIAKNRQSNSQTAQPLSEAQQTIKASATASTALPTNDLTFNIGASTQQHSGHTAKYLAAAGTLTTPSKAGRASVQIETQTVGRHAKAIAKAQQPAIALPAILVPSTATITASSIQEQIKCRLTDEEAASMLISLFEFGTSVGVTTGQTTTERQCEEIMINKEAATFSYSLSKPNHVVAASGNNIAGSGSTSNAARQDTPTHPTRSYRLGLLSMPRPGAVIFHSLKKTKANEDIGAGEKRNANKQKTTNDAATSQEHRGKKRGRDSQGQSITKDATRVEEHQAKKRRHVQQDQSKVSSKTPLSPSPVPTSSNKATKK